MSKKIWRGTEYAGNTVRQKEHTRDPAYNCTVIPDSACFPVKEAMALCRMAVLWNDCHKESKYALAEKVDVYLRAVERMKKKVSKK